MKQLLNILAGVAAVVAALWVFGPYEPAPLTPNVDTSQVGPGLDVYFAAREGAYDDITPGVEKQVIWAGAAGAKTDIALLYVHGFSATSMEIRPVPDRVAEALGANLILTRLTGHGRGGAAMAEAGVQDWINDLAEGIAAARAVGTKVLLMSTSTGGTLVTAALQDAQMRRDVKGAIFVSPNFAVNNSAAALLTLPGAEYWLPLIAGKTRSFEPENAEQAKFWTTEYPSAAVFPMAALVKAVGALDPAQINVPALFVFSDADTVVRSDVTRNVAAAWGAPAQVFNPPLTDADDPARHVIAGDILSPGQTDRVARAMITWARAVP